MDSAKLKLSQLIRPKCGISWNNKVDVVLISLLHLDNPPCANILVAHGVLLYLRPHTPRAYCLSTLSTLLRNVANARSN